MKKNILIIGFGDIAYRLSKLVNKKKYRIYGISRSNKFLDNKDYIYWDWFSQDLPELNNLEFDTIIFFPKPVSLDKEGYLKGFVASAENICKLVNAISYKRFISISSTRIYGKKENKLFTESDEVKPNEYRGKTIKKYEDLQIENFNEKLIILRFSGLYSVLKNRSTNFLHRNNAAEIIKFFIEKDFVFDSYQIFNCSEDSDSSTNISNKKLKKAGFIFTTFN